jgi:magnesium transporter
MTQMQLFDSQGNPRPLPPEYAEDPHGALAAAKGSEGFLWIGLSNPNLNDIAPFAEAFELHPLAVSDVVTGNQQPKAQNYPTHLFVSLWCVSDRLLANPGDLNELFLFVSDDLLLTVVRHESRATVDLQEMMTSTRGPIHEGSFGALYTVMACISQQYAALAGVIETELERLESEVFDAGTTDNAQRIYRLRQQIGRLHRAVSGLARSLATSKEHLGEVISDHPQLQPYTANLLDDIIATGEIISDQSSALDSVISSHENNVSSQQNIDTRKISAIAALLSVPAVLAGLAGMNFKNLPGANWDYGWVALVAIMVIVDAAMFVNFKHRNWL